MKAGIIKIHKSCMTDRHWPKLFEGMMKQCEIMSVSYSENVFNFVLLSDQFNENAMKQYTFEMNEGPTGEIMDGKFVAV